MGIPGVRFFRHEGGQSIVEFALAVPILVFGLVGGIDLLRIGAIQQAIINSARVGAEYAGANPAASPSAVLAQIWAESNGTPGLNAGPGPTPTCAPLTPSPSYNPACAVMPSQTGSPATFQGSTASSGGCTASKASAICYVTVEVRYTFNTIVAWPLVPNQVTVDRTAVMPILR